MALVGGGTGGAANTINPTGTGTSLNYVGDYAYAYSGLVPCDNNETTLLKFTTASSIITAEVLLNYAEDAAHTEDYVFKIKVNSEIIMMFLYDGAKLQNPPQPIPMIIAPFADVEITATNISDTDARTLAAMVTGRVYQ
jgi:hypothetical protein